MAPSGTFDNPPDGAILHYYLKKKPAGEVVLEIIDDKGGRVRKLTSKKEEEEKEEDIDANERRREEKGKASERDAVKVKCRLSDRGGPDVVIFLGRNQTVGALARRIKAETDVNRFVQDSQLCMLIRH